MDLLRKIVDKKPRSRSPTKGRKENNRLSAPSSPYHSFHQPLPRNGYIHSSYSNYPPPHSYMETGINGNYGNSTAMFPPPQGYRPPDSGKYIEYPPVCYLPLPPSPLPVVRNNSRQSNVESGDSLQTWNTEKNNEDSHFYLQPNGYNSTAPNSPMLSPMLSPDLTIRTTLDEMMPGPAPLMRTRSHSPQKRKTEAETKPTSRSKSPQKKNRTIAHTLDFLNSQCHLEGCSATIIVQSTRFLVCRHQLSHASEYFRNLFSAEGTRQPEINVVVSEMSVPSPATQFRWFIESSVPCPGLKDISDDTLETCMRLSRRFMAHGLEIRCNKYIHENASSRQPVVVLCWLNWCLKHRFEPAVQQSCLPAVARLSLTSLEQHRHMLTERIYADLLSAKLRACYDKAVSVFQTIHHMDHFTCELPQCPRCGRTREHMKVRVMANPCRKLIGCERCLRDYGCEIEAKAQGDLQAFYQCPHALLPLNDSTEECHCQTPILAGHLRSSQISSERSRSKTKHRERLTSTNSQQKSN